MSVRIEVRLVWLPLSLEQHRRLLGKGRADHVWTCGHRHAHGQVLVDLFMRRLVAIRDTRGPLRRFDREELQPAPVQEQFEVVWLAETFHMLVAIACQPDGDVVLAIERKRVVDHRAAASADRKAVEVLLLRHVRRDPDGLASRRPAGASDGHAADLLRCRDVTIEEGRREIGDRHIVEAVARLVRRQQRRDVGVERQEIAHGILVLGPREPPDRGRPAGIGMRHGGTVERRLQGRHHGVVSAIVRTLLAHRRHLAGAQLPDDLLPHLRVPGHVVRQDLFEIEPTLFVVFVVAGEAVPVDERHVRWRADGEVAGSAPRLLGEHDGPGRDQAGHAEPQ